MVARFRVETIGLAVAFIAAVLVLGAWGLSGFAIENGDYDREPAVSSRPDWFGCYKIDTLRVVVNENGLSIPGSGVSFTKATVAADKRGSFIYFEPAINMVKTPEGTWQIYRDDKSQMIQKLYVSRERMHRFITIPGGQQEGAKLGRVSSC